MMHPPLEPPLHQAVIRRDYEAVSQMSRDLDHLCCVNTLGFTALEIAQFLDWRPGIELLGGQTKHQLYVEGAAPITKNEFEELMGVRYLPHLKFESYEDLSTVIAYCPWLLRWTPLGKPLREVGSLFRDEIRLGQIADVEVKWIDSAIGRGLFARRDLDEGILVGEYTGKVRPLSRTHPDANQYCLHYPTRFRSQNYYVIDSMQEGNLIRFMNHSDHPTCEPQWALDRNLLHFLLFTKKRLAAGEQLTFDYGQDYWLRRHKIEA